MLIDPGPAPREPDPKTATEDDWKCWRNDYYHWTILSSRWAAATREYPPRPISEIEADIKYSAAAMDEASNTGEQEELERQLGVMHRLEHELVAARRREAGKTGG